MRYFKSYGEVIMEKIAMNLLGLALVLSFFINLTVIIFIYNLDKNIDTSPVLHIPKTELITPNYETGIASWYNYRLGDESWGATHATCASRSAIRYSILKVVNNKNGKSVECYVNDFGPEEDTGRVIDLSSYAFSKIADLSEGLVDVTIYQQ